MTEKIAQPTDAELEILRVLWERGPSTVREVHEVISRTKPAGYTTILKLLQIMTEKGLVRRNEEQRAHVYEPQMAKEQTQRQLLGDLLERAFGGSATELVMQAPLHLAGISRRNAPWPCAASSTRTFVQGSLHGGVRRHAAHAGASSGNLLLSQPGLSEHGH
jgi:BlaI family penicillinase repressor